MRSTFSVSETESKFDFNNVIKVTFSFHSSENSTIWSISHRLAHGRISIGKSFVWLFIQICDRIELRNQKQNENSAASSSSSPSRMMRDEYGLLAYVVNISWINNEFLCESMI